ncbi:phage head spike fiber domain-containing protein [Limnospira platensis CENA597]|uniref:phage head spike fiber domain-containing protein n=1 Tax=Limnospira platensis TaxID=118562 RepID=UPI003DA00022
MTNFNIYSSKFGQSTDDLPEGEVNLYLTNERIQAVIDSNTYNVEPRISIEPTLSTQFGKSNTRYNGEEWITEPVTDTYTVTRASTATYVDAAGRIRTAAVNKPRYTFNPETGERLGLLVEEQRTNLVSWSEDFDNATWTKTRASITPNVIVALDGNLTGDKLVEDSSTNTAHHVNRTFSATSGTTYTLTIYAKAAERSILVIAFATQFPANSFANFNLLTRAITAGGGLVSSSVTSMVNGWYRCSITSTASSTATATIVHYLNNGSSILYTGDGISGIYIWGTQLEASSTPSPYTPTQATSVTRASDAVSRVLGDEFNPSEGSFYIEYTPNKLTGVGAILGTNSDNTNLILHGDDSAGFGIDTRTVSGGVLTYSSPLITRLDAPSFKILSVLEQGRQKLFINGDKVVDAPNTVTSYQPISEILILRRANGVVETGICKDFRYYPRALSESECLALTKL